MGVAPVNEIALELAMNEPAGVMTSSPGPMPIARMPSSSADMPESRPTQCSASQKRASSLSNSATSAPRMKSVYDITLSIAACTSAAIAACCAFKLTRGSLLFSPDIRPFEITLEAHELVDIFDANGRVAGDNDAGLDALGHDAPRADERPGSNANARK